MSHELVIGQDLFEPLYSHLFQADMDEHAAVVLAGVHQERGGLRLLARELHLVPVDEFPPGERGYRQTSPRFVAERAVMAGSQRLAYVALHSHPTARQSVSLSPDDLAAHQRLFPHLLDLTNDSPVAGLALGQISAAGEIWNAGLEPRPLDALTVLGHRRVRLTPAPESGQAAPSRFDRQARMFGDAGQAILRSMNVAVVGAGGGGSMLVEQLAHLGVGAITVFDYDMVKEINLSRIVGSTAADVGMKKVDVLRRLVGSIDPGVRFTGVDGDIANLSIARELLSCDFIFLATDTITSRLVFNSIVHRYLIPGVQIGAKIDVDQAGGISEIYVAVRPVLPDSGCLECNSLIDPMALQRESRTDEEHAAQNYLNEPDVTDPSVISLNGIAASHAVNVMLLWATGLSERSLLQHRLFLARTGEALVVNDRRHSDCAYCSHTANSMYAAGGPAEQLPCRREARTNAPDRPPRQASRVRRALLRMLRRGR